MMQVGWTRSIHDGAEYVQGIVAGFIYIPGHGTRAIIVVDKQLEEIEIEILDFIRWTD